MLFFVAYSAIICAIETFVNKFLLFLALFVDNSTSCVINIPIDAIILSICREFNVNEDWLRTGAGGDENMFVKLSEDEELAMYTQMLLDSTDDVVADMIKEIIVIYEKLDNDSKQALKNVARKLLDKMNGK